jgi:DNA-binding PadR family transcriptional regulator
MRPNTLKHAALALISEHPRTANEVGRRMGRSGVWKRVSDLKNAGLIEKAGEREDALSEQDNIVWGTTERGEEILAVLDAGESATL